MYSLFINTNLYLQSIFFFNCLIFRNWEILCLQYHLWWPTLHTWYPKELYLINWEISNRIRFLSKLIWRKTLQTHLISFYWMWILKILNLCRGRNWCLYLRCWEAKPKLDYGLLRWYPKAFGVMTKPIQARNKGCTWQNSNKSPIKNMLQYLISTLMVLVR